MPRPINERGNSKYANFVNKYKGSLLSFEQEQSPPVLVPVVHIKLAEMDINFIEDELPAILKGVKSIEIINEKITDSTNLLAILKVADEAEVKEIEITRCSFMVQPPAYIYLPRYNSLTNIAFYECEFFWYGFPLCMHICERFTNLKGILIDDLNITSEDALYELIEMVRIKPSLKFIALQGVTIDIFKDLIENRFSASQLGNLFDLSRNDTFSNDTFHTNIDVFDDSQEWPTDRPDRTYLHELVEAICNRDELYLRTDLHAPILVFCNDYLKSYGDYDGKYFFYNGQNVRFEKNEQRFSRGKGLMRE